MSGNRRGRKGSGAVRWLLNLDEAMDSKVRKYAALERVSLSLWVRNLIRLEIERREEK